MLMSLQQRFLLDVLKRLGCVKRKQLYLLAAKNLSLPEWKVEQRHVDIMLNQLRCCTGEIRMDADLVYYGRASPDSEQLEAVDVMLELSEGKPSDFRLERDECLLLRFMLESEGKLRMFSVARFREDTVRLLPAHRTERIIFLADKAELPVGLVLPYRHFFALRQEDGTHRFFAGGEQ